MPGLTITQIILNLNSVLLTRTFCTSRLKLGAHDPYHCVWEVIGHVSSWNTSFGHVVLSDIIFILKHGHYVVKQKIHGDLKNKI